TVFQAARMRLAVQSMGGVRPGSIALDARSDTRAPATTHPRTPWAIRSDAAGRASCWSLSAWESPHARRADFVPAVTRHSEPISVVRPHRRARAVGVSGHSAAALHNTTTRSWA